MSKSPPRENLYHLNHFQRMPDCVFSAISGLALGSALPQNFAAIDRPLNLQNSLQKYDNSELASSIKVAGARATILTIEKLTPLPWGLKWETGGSYPCTDRHRNSIGRTWRYSTTRRKHTIRGDRWRLVGERPLSATQ